MEELEIFCLSDRLGFDSLDTYHITTMIVETTIVPRKQDFILNFNQFVESSASVEKDKSSSKRKATDLFKGKIEIDTDLINQIKN